MANPGAGRSFGVRGFSGLWAVGFGSVGALLTWRRPGHPVGWVFAAAGLVAAVDFATFEYALAAVVGHRSLPTGEYVGWLQLWTWVPFIALITAYLFLLFPDGAAARAQLAAGQLAGRGIWRHRGHRACSHSPNGGQPASTAESVRAFPSLVPVSAIGFGLVGLLGCVVLAAWSLFSRSRRGPSVERMQIKWLAYSGCLVALTLVSSTILSAILSLSAGIAARVAEGALMVAVLAMPVAVAVAVLKYRLYDIDRIISRTLAYSIITGLLVGVYAGLVLLATQVFRVHTPVAVAAATLAAAALFNPLRRRVQRAVDRRFNRARYDADQTIAAFAARLKNAVDLNSVRDDLASVVTKPWNPPTYRCGSGQPNGIDAVPASGSAAMPSRVGWATGLTGWTNFRLRLPHTPGGCRSGSWNAPGQTAGLTATASHVARRRLFEVNGTARWVLGQHGCLPQLAPASSVPTMFPAITRALARSRSADSTRRGTQVASAVLRSAAPVPVANAVM